MKTEIRNLNERITQLTEGERQRKQAAFASHWFGLSEVERQLGQAAFDEYDALRKAGQMTSEDQAQKWLDNLPLENQEVVKKMNSWEDSEN
jgi:hypothetical protein